MVYHSTVLLWTAAAVAVAVALNPTDIQTNEPTHGSDGTRGQVTHLPRSYGSADRRISTGPTAGSRVAISTHYFDRGTPPITIRHHPGTSIRRQRPPVPPYAVQMEPLVQYSQRDPLYHQQQKQEKGSDQSFNDLQHTKKPLATPDVPFDSTLKSLHVNSNELSSANVLTPDKEGSSSQPSKNDHDIAESNQILRLPDTSALLDNEPQAGQLSSDHLYSYDDGAYYLREPEPIIEIIVKESNESLPPPPTVPSPPPRPPTKEPVQVFYVKYKKDSTKYGKDGGVIYDPPVPAVTPATDSDTEEHYTPPTEVSTYPSTPPPAPPQTTTLRTIIHPDSETYHGTGLHVTFGDPHDEDSHDDYLQQSAPHPSVIFPHQNFGQRPSYRPSFISHEPHKRQPETFQQQPLPPFQYSQPPFHQQNAPLSPHQSTFQRIFNSPNHQQRQPQFQQPPLTQHLPFPHQPPPFRHLSQTLPPPPPPPPLQPQQFPHHQQFQQPPFQFQQRPPQHQVPPNQRPHPPQIQQPQQFPSLQRPSFQETLQRPFQQPQNVPQRPNFAQPTPALEQRKPVFPGQPVSEFVNQPEQLRNSPQSTALQQQLKFQQHHHQQPHLLQQHEREHQLLQLQQQQQRQNVHPHHHQQQQHLFTQQSQQQFQQEKQQSPFGAEIVKSISQQLHLSSNGQSNQQHSLTANNRLQPNLQQQLPTPPSLFQQSNQNQQPFTSQQISPSQQLQRGPPTPPTNSFSNSQKLSPLLPSSTSSPTTVTTPKQQESKTEVTNNKNDDKDKNTSSPSALAELPEEVPDDLRQQLLSSGILSNADIQILDYDKVGDIPIENLPPEALENFYGSAGAASAPVPSIVAPETPVEMKVVRYDPTTAEGQELVEKYVRKDATEVDPVALNDSNYNRYLPLKVSGAQFPLPDVPELRGRNVTSVVVLAPVNYEFREEEEGIPRDEDSDRSSREAPLQVRGVQFVAGDVLKQLVKEPTAENFKRWLDQENATDSDRQSIVLLVVGLTNGNDSKDIFMYDVATQRVNKLRGELSSAFVEVAESNASSQELDSVAAPSDIVEQWEQGPFEEPSAVASELFEDKVLPSQVADISTPTPQQVLIHGEIKDKKKTSFEDHLVTSASEPDDKTSNVILVSSGYSKTSDFTGPGV